MSPFVDLGIVVSRRYAVAFRRDDWRDVMCRQGISQAVCIERTVCQKVIGGQLFDQLWHAAQVVRLTRQQAEIDKISKRVRQRQYLGGDAATRAPYSLALSPPFAPWPERWSLTMVPSIIAYSRSASALKALNMR